MRLLVHNYGDRIDLYFSGTFLAKSGPTNTFDSKPRGMEHRNE